MCDVRVSVIDVDMEKLARLREDRRKLELIETRVLSSSSNVAEDAQALHAWAAQELKQLSDSIRGTCNTAGSLVGSDTNSLHIAHPDANPPHVASPSSTFEAASSSIVGTHSVVQGASAVQNAEVLHFPESVDSLTDISPIRSEARTNPGKKEDVAFLSVQSLSIPPATARRPNSSVDFELSSLTASNSVSVEDEFSADSIRESSPEPLRGDVAPRHTVHLDEIFKNHRPEKASDILDKFIENCAIDDARRRVELGSFARSLFNEVDGSLERRQTLSPIKADSSRTMARENAGENLPPLTSIEKRTKSGISMNIDLTSFNRK